MNKEKKENRWERIISCPYCEKEIEKLKVTTTAQYIERKCPYCENEFIISPTTGLVSKLDWVVEAKRISNLYKLPSEQQEAVQKAIERLEKTGELDIYEPCDCGNHIQHNNGGNYHQIYEITKDDNAYFIKDDCTSELEPPATWESSTKEEVYQLIQNCADWELY